MPSQNGGAPAPVGIIRERSGDGLSAWRAHTPGGAGRPRSRPASREKPHLRPLTLAQSAGVDRQVVEGRPYTPRAVVPDGLESTQDDGLQSSPVGQRPPGRPTVWTPSHMDPVAQALSGKDAAEVAARMRGRERRRLLVAATPDRYQAASRRHNRGRSPREWKTPPPQTRGRSRSLEQASRSPRPLGSATAACVQLSDAGTPPSRQFAFKGGSVKRHQANSASPDGLPPIAMRSTPTEVSPAKTAGSPRRDSAKAKTEPSFKDTPMEPFVNLQQLSGMWLGVSSGSLYMDSYLDRYQPSKIQPSTKPVLRRGSSWLEVQQSAARENLYAHGPFLEPHAVDATAVLKLQAIENMPRSPPPLYRPLNVEAEDRAPRGWHPRDNQQNAPFVGIVFEVASDQENRSLELGAGFYNQNPIQRRPSVDAVREKIANPCKCGIRYSSIGQSWKVDPDLDPSLSETASNMRRSLTGRWSVEPTAPSQPWKGVHKRRTSHDPISDGYTVQRSISTGGGLEVSGNKSMGRSFEHETDPPGGESTLTYIARKGPGAFHLVGAPIPSLQRDGYRSRCGRTLDAMQGHQDTSPLTHGSYSEWREDPAKLGKMPERKLKMLHNQIGEVKAELLRVDWTRVPVSLPQLLPAAARADITHPSFRFWQNLTLLTPLAKEPQITGTDQTHTPHHIQANSVADGQSDAGLGVRVGEDGDNDEDRAQVWPGTTFLTEQSKVLGKCKVGEEGDRTSQLQEETDPSL